MRKSSLLRRVSSYASMIVGNSANEQEARLEAMRLEHEAALKAAHHPMPMRRPGNISSTQRRWKPPRRLVVAENNVAQHTNREGEPLTHIAKIRESATKVVTKVMPTAVHRSVDLLFAKKFSANQTRAAAGRWCN